MGDHYDRNLPAPEAPGHGDAPGSSAPSGASRREFLKSGVAFAAGAAAGQLLPGGAAAHAVDVRVVNADPDALEAQIEAQAQDLRRRGRTLIKGGVVLSLDPKVGDFEEADVLIEGKTIAAVGPNLSRHGTSDDTAVIDARGTIVMPGFITTHHHQYYTIQRSIIPDGFINRAGADEDQQPNVWPYESYSTVAGQIWTAGRIPDPANPGSFIWDLGRHPYEPEDNYISELVACLSEITQGITMGADISQASHTPEHTDAMIQGLMDSGRRSLYVYSSGTDRSESDGIPYEYPGVPGDTTRGIGRLRARWFSSEDQLVTLGFAGGPSPFTNPDGSETPYTGWQLAREYGAHITNHSGSNPVRAAADPRNGTDWSDVTIIHCVQWQDNPLAQVSYDELGYPNPATSQAWQIFSERGGHASISTIIEMQMRHGMPPLQLALNHGILPSLSPDVDTNMTPDPFSIMRGTFCLQRLMGNVLTIPLEDPGRLPTPQVVTARQVIEMATIAGAAGNGVLHKVGTLTPGKEADIVVLDASNINIAPMNNVPGTVVTMMDTSHVRHVLIAGKVVYWRRKLVGWKVRKLVQDVTRARDRVLARINGPAKVGRIPPGKNSESNPYRPNFLGSCCYNGQNESAPHYQLRP